MRPLDYCGRKKSKEWETNAEMRERRLYLTVDHNFSSVQSTSSNQGVHVKNVMLDTAQKKVFLGQWDKSSAQEVEIINLNNLEVYSSPMRRARTSTTPHWVKRSSRKKSCDDSRLQKGSETSAAKPQAPVDVVEMVTEEAKERPEEMPKRPAAGPKQMVHFGFDDRLGGSKRPDYSELLMASKDISRSWVVECCGPVCFRRLEADEKYEYVTLFLRSFLI